MHNTMLAVIVITHIAVFGLDNGWKMTGAVVFLLRLFPILIDVRHGRSEGVLVVRTRRRQDTC
jgi:hypothetical protein